MSRYLLLALFIVALGAAPQPLTFADAIGRATSDGFDTRIARANAEETNAAAHSKAALTRPAIGITGTAIDENLSQLGFPVSKQAYLSATASVPLLSRATNASARAAGFAALGAGEHGDVADARDDAALAAARAYRRAQLAQAILDARQTALDDQREHVRRTDQQIAVGRLARYIGVRNRAQLALAEQSHEDAAAERDEALNDLAALLALPADSALTVSEPLTAIDIALDRDVLLKRALIQRADIIAAHLRVRAAEGDLAAARAAFTPVIALAAQSYNGTSAPDIGRAGGSIAITGSLPIIDGGTRQAGIDDAAARLSRARIDAERIEALAERDVADAWRELEAARIGVAAADATLQDALEELRIARIRESAGKATDLEAADALALAASARETKARSIARIDIAVAMLRRACGDPQI